MALPTQWEQWLQQPVPRLRSRMSQQLHVIYISAAVPHHFYNEVRHKLVTDIGRGITEEVPAGERTKYCPCIVVLPEKRWEATQNSGF